MKASFWEKPASLMKLIKTIAITTVISTSLLACTSNEKTNQQQLSNNSYIIHGGKIITMAHDSADDELYPEAIWIKNGTIQKLGQYDIIHKEAKADDIYTRSIDLKGNTLMPGFIEPHSHLAYVVGFSVMTDLSPCLPDPYTYTYYDDDKFDFEGKNNTKCPESWDDTFRILNSSSKRQSPGTPGWIWGNGIDPSRMGNSEDEKNQTEQFINDPAGQLDDNVERDGEQPILLFDQSGHVAYVNTQAFVSAGICASTEECGKTHTIGGYQDQCTEDKTKFCLNEDGIGGFEVNDQGKFTGRILEAANFVPFINSIVKSLAAANKDEDYKNSPFVFLPKGKGMIKAREFVDRFSKTGATTMVNAGSFTTSEMQLFQDLVNKDKPNMRYRTLISVDIIDNSEKPESDKTKLINSLYTSTWDEDTKGLYGSYGLKLWADGSTQGCSAYLHQKYNDHGICKGTPGDAGQNYKVDNKGDDTLRAALHNYWGISTNKNWLIQIHANGDAAIQQTLDVFKDLQETNGCQNGAEKAGVSLPLTLHHATVGANPATGSNTVEKIKELRATSISCKNSNEPNNPQKLDITVSHTPAHVAYWGGAFQSILDGKGEIDTVDDIIIGVEADIIGRATMIDPAKTETDDGIPFSLHSDAPVSPFNPLWYVEQMVTRDTWFYPHLKTQNKQTMPVNAIKNPSDVHYGFGKQNVDVYKALQGITTVPAKQNLLFDKIGSLEVGKVADLVILDGNPLDAKPLDEKLTISKIKACYTFVNGHMNNYSHTDENKKSKCTKAIDEF